MVSVLPSTVMAWSLALGVGVGAVPLVATQEVGLGEVGSRAVRERLSVERALHAPLDLLSGDRRAVLPLRAVTHGELPLGEVCVRRAEVGGQVGHQDHVAGGLVVDVLRQLTHHQAGHDRVGVGVVEVGRVDRGGEPGRREHRHGAALGRPVDGHWSGGLGVLAAAGIAEVLRVDACSSAGPGVSVSITGSATGGERQEPGRGQRHERLLQPHLGLPFVGLHPTDDGCHRRVLGSNASRIESPSRLRLRVRTVITPTGSQR